MEAPCVRVPREEGEATRRDLADADLLDETLEIETDEGWLYLPIEAPSELPEGYEVVTRDVTPRETQTLPSDLLSFQPSYERLGEIAIVDEDDPDRARELADAIVASDLPVETVINRASKIKGETRVREWEVLAGEDTETVHREHGCEFLVDVARVYFSPRLATDRHLVAEAVRPGERAFDMFAGVGPYAIPFAERGADVVAVDVNDVAIEYLAANARRNGVEDRITAICGDVREIAPDYEGWADRIVMNLPHSADEFLDVAVALASEECVIHYYDIQSEDDRYGPGEAAIRAAGDGYDVTIENRRTVRSYAPREWNVRIDARLRRSD